MNKLNAILGSYLPSFFMMEVDFPFSSKDLTVPFDEKLILRIWNFRRFSKVRGSFESALPGVEVCFKDVLNELVGENDSGKTAIVDAIRYS